jgi:Flp pilus assembly protein TadG
MRFSKLRNERGAAAVEFAIVLPLLLFVVFGIIEFSIIFYDKAMITNASREGARAGIVYRPGDPPRLTEQEIKDVVDTYLQTHLISFGGTSSATVTAPAAGSATGTPLTVTVDYTYNFLLLPNFMDSLTGGLDMQAQTIMRME